MVAPLNRKNYLSLFTLTFKLLFHNELLGVAASADEIDTAAEVRHVDAVGADGAVVVGNHLTHDVVNNNLRAVVQNNIEGADGRVGPNRHLGVV